MTHTAAQIISLQSKIKAKYFIMLDEHIHTIKTTITENKIDYHLIFVVKFSNTSLK